MRTETDFLGSVSIPQNALYGIHAMRAKENFPDTTLFQKEWFSAMGSVKLACYLTYKDFVNALQTKFKGQDIPIKIISSKKLESLILAAEEVALGQHFEHFIVPAVQGGAGTSINMNINEIITNRALILNGFNPGDYHEIHPVEDANIYQSTNDVVPTALKTALLKQLNTLEEKVNLLRNETEQLETEYRYTLRTAHTQMQQAVPSSYGLLFSAYSEALSRDWMRVSKAFERIKTVNLGGSAAGTTLTVPRFFVMTVVRKLQEITKLPIAQSENLVDSTSNLDPFVEIHGILKAHAVNLEKIVADVRLLASDIAVSQQLSIPKRQVGSSIMPGKVNPVIPEFVVSATHKIYASDTLITSLSAQGCLDLNAYLPAIGHELISSINLLIGANETLQKNLFLNLKVNKKLSETTFLNNPSTATALLPYWGYINAGKIANLMQEKRINIFEANAELNLISEEKLKDIMLPANLLKTGFSISDIS